MGHEVTHSPVETGKTDTQSRPRLLPRRIPETDDKTQPDSDSAAGRSRARRQMGVLTPEPPPSSDAVSLGLSLLTVAGAREDGMKAHGRHPAGKRLYIHGSHHSYHIPVEINISSIMGTPRRIK